MGRGHVKNEKLKTFEELHQTLVDKLTILKPMRMELELNFDLIKSLNSKKKDLTKAFSIHTVEETLA